MSSVKKIAKPIADEGSQEAFRTVAMMKSAAPDFQQLAKLARAHHQANAHAISTGKQLVDHLMKLTSKMESRLDGVTAAFVEISSTQKLVLTKFEDLNTQILDSLCTTVQTALVKERTDLATYEKNYHKQHQAILAQVRKAEKQTQKAGKKGPQALQEAIADLTEKMNSITEHRQTKLTEILLLERKKYCDMLQLWNNVADAQMACFIATNESLQNMHGKWKEVATTYTSLSPEAVDFLSRVGKRERTATAIQGDAGGEEEYYDEEYYDEEYYDEEYYDEEGYEEEGYEEDGYYDEGAAPAATVTARALYDYVGQQDYELCFSAGDIISIHSEDNETGWWTGELNGQVGPFPGNYVEKV